MSPYIATNYTGSKREEAEDYVLKRKNDIVCHAETQYFDVLNFELEVKRLGGWTRQEFILCIVNLYNLIYFGLRQVRLRPVGQSMPRLLNRREIERKYENCFPLGGLLNPPSDRDQRSWHSCKRYTKSNGRQVWFCDREDNEDEFGSEFDSVFDESEFDDSGFESDFYAEFGGNVLYNPMQIHNDASSDSSAHDGVYGFDHTGINSGQSHVVDNDSSSSDCEDDFEFL